MPSEKRFGFFISIICIAFSGKNYFTNSSISTIQIYLTSLSVVIILITIIKPVLLRPLNWCWFKTGEILGKVMSPVILGIIFFAILTPVSMLSRFFGRDALRLKKNEKSNSYWILRHPPGPEPESFKNQF